MILNPFTPRSDQDRISPYNKNTISSRQVMRVVKDIHRENTIESKNQIL